MLRAAATELLRLVGGLEWCALVVSSELRLLLLLLLLAVCWCGLAVLLGLRRRLLTVHRSGGRGLHAVLIAGW